MTGWVSWADLEGVNGDHETGGLARVSKSQAQKGWWYLTDQPLQ